MAGSTSARTAPSSTHRTRRGSEADRFTYRAKLDSTASPAAEVVIDVAGRVNAVPSFVPGPDQRASGKRKERKVEHWGHRDQPGAGGGGGSEAEFPRHRCFRRGYPGRPANHKRLRNTHLQAVERSGVRGPRGPAPGRRRHGQRRAGHQSGTHADHHGDPGRLSDRGTFGRPARRVTSTSRSLSLPPILVRPCAASPGRPCPSHCSPSRLAAGGSRASERGRAGQRGDALGRQPDRNDPRAGAGLTGGQGDGSLRLPGGRNRCGLDGRRRGVGEPVERGDRSGRTRRDSANPRRPAGRLRDNGGGSILPPEDVVSNT